MDLRSPPTPCDGRPQRKHLTVGKAVPVESGQPINRVSPQAMLIGELLDPPPERLVEVHKSERQPLHGAILRGHPHARGSARHPPGHPLKGAEAHRLRHGGGIPAPRCLLYGTFRGV